MEKRLPYMQQDNRYILLIDEKFRSTVPEEEFQQLKPILIDFIKTAAKNQDKPIETWLIPKMQEQLPEKTPEEIQQITEELLSAIKITEEKQASLTAAVANGRSKESWFASEIRQYASHMSTQASMEYVKSLDQALTNANEALRGTFTTQTGAINQNPNLDGYLAEQWHAQTFNLNAEAQGSPYFAEVKEPPPGSAYGKNSVDIVIKDQTGHEVRRYQAKYCKTADATNRALHAGNYRGQRKLVPADQKEYIPNSSDVIEAPDGTTSEPLTKRKAMKLRDSAQNQKWQNLTWNEYNMKDVAIGIGKQAGFSALQGAAAGTGIYVAQKIFNGEKINKDELIEYAIRSGADTGIKAAAASALKVGMEKNIISFIPKGTPVSVLANIANIAVENLKILSKIASGELSFKDGIDKMKQIAVSTAAGMAVSTEGAAIGAAIGTVFGPVGTFIGGCIGGAIGFAIGSELGEVFVKTAKKIRDMTKPMATEVWSSSRSVFSVVSGVVSSAISGIGSFFGF